MQGIGPGCWQRAPGRRGSGAGGVLTASAPEEAIRPPGRKHGHRRLSIGPRARQGVGERAELGCPGPADVHDGEQLASGWGVRTEPGATPAGGN